MTPPLFGVAGWKNSGKTTLMVGLIAELARRGYEVCVIKHAHASFEIDHEGRDSFKMRAAGARQVALSSPRRFALMRELGGAPELSFEENSRLCRSLRCRLGRRIQARGVSEDRNPQRRRRVPGAARRNGSADCRHRV